MLIVRSAIITVMDSGHVTALGSVKDKLDLSNKVVTGMLIVMDIVLNLLAITTE